MTEKDRRTIIVEGNQSKQSFVRRRRDGCRIYKQKQQQNAACIAALTKRFKGTYDTCANHNDRKKLLRDIVHLFVIVSRFIRYFVSGFMVGFNQNDG